AGARSARLLGRRDPPADRARGHRAPAHHPRRRPRPAADRRPAAGARRSARPGAEARRHGPGMSAAAASRAQALHVEVVGSGPPLVLLHGWAMHGGVFAPLVERLRGSRTLYVVDLPGHGHSRDCALPLQLEPCVAAVAAAVPPAPWCGWSLGGLLALHAAATRPQAVPALAMLCATPRFVRGDGWK